MRHGSTRGKVPSLGAQFLEDADRAVDVITEAPDRWRVVEADVRRYLMTRFPYAIFCRMNFASSRSSTTAATQITGASVSQDEPQRF